MGSWRATASAASWQRQVALWLGVAAFALVAGCGKAKPASPYPEEGAGQGKVAESDLGGGPAPGSSLAQFKRGALGEGGTGPLDDVFFGYDSFALDETARETLRLNAEWLRVNPDVRVEIEGHCDSRGTVEYNLALGARRATAARDYLVSLGISAARLTTISYGEELPVCREETEGCWARNRRVHFALLG